MQAILLKATEVERSWKYDKKTPSALTIAAKVSSMLMNIHNATK
jgi:hypothetical protein